MKVYMALPGRALRRGTTSIVRCRVQREQQGLENGQQGLAGLDQRRRGGRRAQGYQGR